MEEISKEIMNALNIKEDPNKNDIFLLKRGTSLEIQETRDIAGHIQSMCGETTIRAFMTFLKEAEPGIHIGQLFLVVGADEECPQFVNFLKKQAVRLKFKLIVFLSPLPQSKLAKMEQTMLELGALPMQ